MFKNLEPEKFFPVFGLARQEALKMVKEKLGLLTNINLLLMIEKEISGRTCHSINRYNRYAEATDKYMNDYNKNKELSYFKQWDVKNMYGCAMPQKLTENVFK